MSGQINDKLIYNDAEYNISAIEFPEAFIDIYSLGIKPKMNSTACWRGYVATYTINNSKLVLDKLYTNNGNNIENEPPLINNKLPNIIIKEGLIDEYKNSRDFVYENIDLPINYTGSIIITNELIMERYVHMGFQSPTSYKVVIQLIFNEGQLVSSNDLSSIATSIRKNNIELAERKINKMDLIQWIKDSFNISFFNKAKELTEFK